MRVDELKPPTFEQRRARLLELDAPHLRTHLRESLAMLEADARLVDVLLDSHQAGYGFLTPDQKAAVEIQAAKDRRDQAVRLKSGEPLGHGAIATPGNIGAISLSDVTRRGLRASVRMLTDHLYRRPRLCVTRPLPAEPTLYQLAGHLLHLADLVLDTDVEVLADVAAGLDEHIAKLQAFIDGQDQQRIGTHCPHCGRNTLILFRREFVIRCLDEPTATTFAPCTCNDPLCECKTRPVTFRHAWAMNAGSSSSKSWRSLAGALGVQRLAGVTGRTRSRTRKSNPKEPNR